MPEPRNPPYPGTTDPAGAATALNLLRLEAYWTGVRALLTTPHWPALRRRSCRVGGIITPTLLLRTSIGPAALDQLPREGGARGE